MKKRKELQSLRRSKAKWKRVKKLKNSRIVKGSPVEENCEKKEEILQHKREDNGGELIYFHTHITLRYIYLRLSLSHTHALARSTLNSLQVIEGSKEFTKVALHFDSYSWH
ncbi:hypothetical protein L6452_35844 [Arctium lappa]|uniref:Uncharacterized protein n=1 Tax=Arctium lappa TaxID=4217 RepID=A0ACB8Y835_ARCLA|nr:hypothetical protein L6452_35844 [Arctium lappa]